MTSLESIKRRLDRLHKEPDISIARIFLVPGGWDSRDGERPEYELWWVDREFSTAPTRASE